MLGAAAIRRRMPTDLLFRAAFVSVVLTMLGSVLGLARDLLMANLFGASAETDAFLIAWTVPETAAPLLIEDAMAFLLVPMFSAAVAQRRSVRDVVAATLPRIMLLLVVVTGTVAVAAPLLVDLIAPDLAEPELAARAMRLVAVTVVMFGLAGYLSAALRSHQVFVPPAAIYIAFNVGILTTMLLLHEPLGVLSVALGISVGSTLMVLVQLPSFIKHVGSPLRISRTGWIGLGVVAPIVTYTLTRQGQVLVERFFGAGLEAGTISHLNYAQKVAQVPMVLAVTVATVTFPILAGHLAGRRADAARRRVETDLTVIGGLVLLATAYLVAYAPQVIAVLFEHGDFTAADTAETAAIIRVYSLGLLGQALVGVLCRSFFSGGDRTWFPAAAMAGGLLATVLAAMALVHPWGALGIAAGNAIGITLTAVLMLAGLRLRVAISVPSVLAALGRIGVAAAGAGALGLLAARSMTGLPDLLSAVAGGLLIVLSFALLAYALGVPELRLAAAKLKRGS